MTSALPVVWFCASAMYPVMRSGEELVAFRYHPQAYVVGYEMSSAEFDDARLAAQYLTTRTSLSDSNVPV